MNRRDFLGFLGVAPVAAAAAVAAEPVTTPTPEPVLPPLPKPTGSMWGVPGIVVIDNIPPRVTVADLSMVSFDWAAYYAQCRARN